MTKQPDILFIKILEDTWYGNVDKVVPVLPEFKIPVVAGHFHTRHYWELLLSPDRGGVTVQAYRPQHLGQFYSSRCLKMHVWEGGAYQLSTTADRSWVPLRYRTHQHM